MVGGGDIIYRLNDRDEIVFVNQKWDQFAAANEGKHVASSLVLGRLLWDFIADPTTRQLYRDILTHVRGGRSVRFKFRCDSPSCRRLLEMEVIAGKEDAVEFRTRTISEEPRQHQPLLVPRTGCSDDLLSVCGWCRKIYIGSGWVEVEEAVFQLQLFESPPLPLLTHGICGACYEEMTTTLAAPAHREIPCHGVAGDTMAGKRAV